MTMSRRDIRAYFQVPGRLKEIGDRPRNDLHLTLARALICSAAIATAGSLRLRMVSSILVSFSARSRDSLR
jgi:hypothetical protein